MIKINVAIYPIDYEIEHMYAISPHIDSRIKHKVYSQFHPLFRIEKDI